MRRAPRVATPLPEPTLWLSGITALPRPKAQNWTSITRRSLNWPEVLRLCRNSGAERLQHRQKSAQVEGPFACPMSQSSGPSLAGRGTAAFAAALTLAGVPGLAQAQQQPQSAPPPPVQGLYSNMSGAT